MMKILRRYWQDWGNFAIGMWLFMSPWFLGYSMETSAVWNSMVAGALIVVLSSFAALVHQVAEEWVTMAFGVWLMASPWVLGFSGESLATGNTVFFGAVVTGFAAWAMLRDLGLVRWWHKHYHHSA